MYSRIPRAFRPRFASLATKNLAASCRLAQPVPYRSVRPGPIDGIFSCCVLVAAYRQVLSSYKKLRCSMPTQPRRFRCASWVASSHLGFMTNMHPLCPFVPPSRADLDMYVTVPSLNHEKTAASSKVRRSCGPLAASPPPDHRHRGKQQASGWRRSDAAWKRICYTSSSCC